MTLDQIHAYLSGASGKKKMSYEEARDSAVGARGKREEWSADTMQQMIYGSR